MEMTASSNPLVRDVANAIKRKHNQSFEEQAKAALDACHAEEIVESLKAAHAHVQELRDAWQRGAISEHDGQGGTRSNRNVDVEIQLRDLLAKLDGQPSPPPVLGYCPICGAPGRSREKRPFGNDHCEAGHSYPSRNALLAKLGSPC